MVAAHLPRLLIALVAVSAVALPACGGGDDKEDIEQTVRDFVSATNDRDAGEFCGEIVTQEFLDWRQGRRGRGRVQAPA
jgi:hypothetical protein